MKENKLIMIMILLTMFAFGFNLGIFVAEKRVDKNIIHFYRDNANDIFQGATSVEINDQLYLIVPEIRVKEKQIEQQDKYTKGSKKEN